VTLTKKGQQTRGQAFPFSESGFVLEDNVKGYLTLIREKNFMRYISLDSIPGHRTRPRSLNHSLR